MLTVICHVSGISPLWPGSSIWTRILCCIFPPVNSDPLEYIENNPPTNGWTFATGETVGLSNANGTYYYDMEMFLEDKLVESYSTGDMKIPLTTIGMEGIRVLKHNDQ